LFGYLKGAFTGASRDHIGHFEQADKGTIFLDEIGEVSLSNQTKLLRVIQEKKIKKLGDFKEKKINVRIICATNADINNEDIFRSDLYYRINELELVLPPLRERDNRDKEILINHFLKIERDKKQEFEFIKYSDEALNEIYEYSWPGNVRELENFVKKTFNNAANWYRNFIEPEDFSYLLNQKTVLFSLEKDSSKKDNSTNHLSLKERLDLTEKGIIIKALEKNKTQILVAKELGISQPIISKKLKAHGISIKDYKN